MPTAPMDTFKKKSNRLKLRTLAIIPCYNEAVTIASLVLKSKRYVDTVLVIDDGSIDDTSAIAKEAGAIVIKHKINRGKGAALKTGFTYAVNKGYDYAVTIDGDGQLNPIEIPQVLGSILNNGHDVAIGIRAGERTEMPGWRKIGKRILDYSTSLGNGGEITDSQCGFRAFNHHAMQAMKPHLKENGFSVESEQLILANELKLKLKKADIHCRYEHLQNTSTLNPA